MSEKPQRIQLSRKKGWKMPEYTIKVDRSSGFGNPFPITKATMHHMGQSRPVFWIGTEYGPGEWMRETKDEAQNLAVAAYKAWINGPAQTKLKARIPVALRGKNLACWCTLDDPCHADVLLEIANA
ncbi:MAG: DUF4326 domain-containing protein [Rhodospirillales bacterium]|nr:DUF4326 domain-containing protein [Rhodospirillales bacterium]